MHHGHISQEIARGLRTLRARIQKAEIPPSKLDETLNLATWNIREFGKAARQKAALHYIAEVIGQFDLVAVIEVRDNLTHLNAVLDILGPYWKVVFSDFNSDPVGNRERIAYVYDKRAVAFTGLAAEADPPKEQDPVTGRYESKLEWWRSPYMASFRAGDFDFILLAVHIRWGDSYAERCEAIEAVADWVEERRNEEHVIDKDIILLGDFNIPSASKRSKAFKAISKHGLQIPRALTSKKNRDLCSNLSKNKRYDQILHYPTYPDTFTGAGGVVDFYAGNHKAFFPNLSKDKFTFQVSDHLPLWIQIATDIDHHRIEDVLNA